MRALRLVLVGASVLMMPSALAAQKLTTGSWTGTVTPPDGPTLNAVFEVRMSGDTAKILMKVDGREVELSDIKVEANRLLFTFSPGTVVKCTLLLRQDKSYGGDCLDGDGGKGVIVMNPPKPGGDAP